MNIVDFLFCFFYATPIHCFVVTQAFNNYFWKKNKNKKQNKTKKQRQQQQKKKTILSFSYFNTKTYAVLDNSGRKYMRNKKRKCM